MIGTRIRRGLVAFAALLAAVTLSVAVAQQPASAADTRTITGSTTCTSGIMPYGFEVDYGAGWTDQGGTSYPDYLTQTKVWTWVIPTTATYIALRTFCYYNWNEFYGTQTYPQGTWIGYYWSLVPGTSDITSTWSCTRYPIYPGPFVQSCTMTSVSYA